MDPVAALARLPVPASEPPFRTILPPAATATDPLLRIRPPTVTVPPASASTLPLFKILLFTARVPPTASSTPVLVMAVAPVSSVSVLAVALMVPPLARPMVPWPIWP